MINEYFYLRIKKKSWMEWMIAFEIYFIKDNVHRKKSTRKLEWNNNRNNWKGIVLKSIGGTKGGSKIF